MRVVDNNNAENTSEKEKLTAYFMTFAISAYEIIENEDAAALLKLITTSVDDMCAYREGKPLPEPSPTSVGPKKSAWRVL